MSKKATSARDWKKKSKGEEVEVPSGNIALVRPLGMDVFLKKGVIPNSLMPIVQKALNDKTAPSREDIKFDPDNLEEVITMADTIVCNIMIEPKVSPVPPEDQERKEDVLYVDEVDFEDKMFLFSWAMRSADELKPFRGTAQADVAPVPSGEDVEVAAQSAS